MNRIVLAACLAAAGTLSQAAVTTLTDPAAVLDFQQGLQVETFESINGRTPAVLGSFSSGAAIGEAAKVFNQVSGVRMSAGGTVGVQRPALYQINPDVVIESTANTVLGATDSDGLSLFDSSSLIEMHFPTKVAELGFQVQAGLAPVIVYVLNTVFAFTQLDEEVLETLTVQPGQFVAFTRSAADIGGLKILSGGSLGFAIDNLSFGGQGDGGGSVPVPGTAALGLVGLVTLVAAGIGRRRSAR